MIETVETHILPPDDDIPNSPLPLLLYPQALASADRDADACQSLFARNHWGGTWVDGIFDYWHFHLTGHEVLGCVHGEAEVGFGGDRGIEITFSAGDVVVIPAGVGHKRLSERRGGFTVVGAYPQRQSGAITRRGEISPTEAQRRIAALALPKSDPLRGPDGPLIEAWRVR